MVAPSTHIDLGVRARIRAWVLHFRALYYQDRTDRELADDLGLATSTVNGIISGKRTAGLDVVLALRRTFSVSADILLTADPSAPVFTAPAKNRPTPERR